MGSLQPDDRYDRSSRDPEVAWERVKAEQQGTSTTKRDERRKSRRQCYLVMAIKDLITPVGSDCHLLQRR
jgi:ribonuclease PH